jgi:toxin ParE1/3/4
VRRFIQEAARTDILGQYQHYLGHYVPAVADRFLDAVNESIDSVVAMPDAGTPKQFDNPRLKGLRTWSVKGFDEFRIYYLISDDLLIVVRVLHGRRDVRSLLEEPDDVEGAPID